MKYTIEGFSQEEALSLKKEVIKKVDGKAQTKILKLDVIDLMLLRWFVDFYPNMKKKIIGETQYAWVNYQSIVNDLPLLDIEKRPVYNRFLKMCELGILIHHHDKVGGSFSYYSFGENYSRLIKKTPMNQNSQGCESKFIGGMNQNSQGVGTKIPTKDSSINNSSINNSSSIKEYEEEKEENNQYSETETVANKIKKIPDETIRNKLLEIMKTRERKGKPITYEVLKMILERLNKYSDGNKEKQIEILDVSVMNGYDTVFPLNSYNKHSKNYQYPDESKSYDVSDWEKLTSGDDYLLNAIDNLA